MKKNKATILPPSKRLKEKLGRKLEELIDSRQIDKAQQITRQHDYLFKEQIAEDMAAMEEAFDFLLSHTDGHLPPLHALQTRIFRIKSIAGTFGYGLASAVAKQLHDFLEDKATLPLASLKIIEAHIETLRSIFQHGIQGDGGKKGQEVLESLRRK